MNIELKILLVDDDELNYRLVSNYVNRTLRRMKIPYQIMYLKNGQDFFNYLEDCNRNPDCEPDIILVDYNLGTYRFPQIIEHLETTYGNIFEDRLYVFTCFSKDEIKTSGYPHINKDNGDRLLDVILSKVV